MSFLRYPHPLRSQIKDRENEKVNDMGTLSGSCDSLLTSPPDSSESEVLQDVSISYSLYCRLAFGVRNVDSWDSVAVCGLTLPIFDTETTAERCLSTCHFHRMIISVLEIDKVTLQSKLYFLLTANPIR